MKQPMKVTEQYARLAARDAYFWAWPLVNIYNRRLAFSQCPRAGLMNGVLPFAPLNQMSMLHDYIEPEERWVACPNQDVVYGAGIAALDKSPVVLQVPDFGKRFWVYQLVDLGTDSFADIGAMYGTRPGLYLLVGPKWKGGKPRGITRILRCRSSTAFVVPRVAQNDDAADKAAVRAVIGGIDMYPLSKFNGKPKHRDWETLPSLGNPGGDTGSGETPWVLPEKFLEQLPAVLADAPPRPGEESRYAEALALAAVASQDPALRQAMIEECQQAERELIGPLLQFRNWGVPLPHHWSTIDNGAAFGSDYFTRTAVAKSNILVNKSAETRYFYQDLDVDGARLDGSRCHVMTFAKGQLPPVKGFWSLTLYNEQHFFEPNPIKRYSLGSKNRDLQVAADGSLSIYVQPEEPKEPAQRRNWLPSPRTGGFSLYVRAYWPKPAIASGKWTPPAVVPMQRGNSR